MTKKFLALALVILVMTTGLFAAKKPQTRIQNYASIGAAADFGWSTEKTTAAGVTISSTTKTNYIPLRADGVNYIGNYFGINYGIGINIPVSMYIGDTKEDDVSDVLPVEFAVRAAFIGRYPVSKSLAIGGKFGVAVNGGMMESTLGSGSYTTTTKTLTTRFDITLGALFEVAFSDSIGLVAGFDVLFPVSAANDVTTEIKTPAGTNTSKSKTNPDYKRYGVAPYVGIAFMY